VNRRDLIASAIAALGAAAVAPARARCASKNYAWITLEKQRTTPQWRETFAAWRASGIHGVIVEAYNGRQAFFSSTRLPVAYDRLGSILPAARAEQLEVHAWMWAMPCLVDEIMRKHPDWYNVNARGESALDKPAYVDYYKFLDPANPEVRDWVRGTVRELAAIDGVDAVHLDYIRHPDAILPKHLWPKYGVVQDRVLPEFDYGYSAVSLARFKQKHGDDPRKNPEPAVQQAWLQQRLDSVTELVNEYLVPAAHAAGKKISAAVFPGPTLARRMVYQDWGAWRLDSYHPMLYHSFYEADARWVRDQTREAVSTVKAPIYSGLFAPDVVASGLKPLIAGALEGGAAGVTLFHGDALDASMWKVLAEVCA
jgi:uncharacterized lipoprotein YddW (UPF0748 family)